MLLSDEEQENASSFYSPLCKTKPYLTPEQRKRLREKRNIELSTEPGIDDNPSKPNKKARRLFNQKPKSKTVVKKALQKKLPKAGLPEVCCTAAEWVPQNNIDFEKKKFFKTRSPEHLKKAKFILDYKKSRLDFSEGKHSKIRDNGQDNSSKSEPSTTPAFDKNELNSSDKMTESPHIVRVASTQEESTETFGEKDLKDLVLESASEAVQFSSDKAVESTSSAVKTEIQASCSTSTSPSSDVKEKKLTTSSKPKNYPIFDRENIKKIKWDISLPEKFCNGSFRTKDKSKGDEQMIIDAGQKKIGATMCSTCGMVYTIGHEEDEKLHSENHDMYLQLKFPGWKDERVIGSYNDGRVIKILKDDKNFRLKKVQDILLVVNRDLGFPSSVFNGYLQGKNIMIILFVANDKFVKGCLVAESISSASPVVLDKRGSSKSYYASSETVRAICGINRIWVARKHRKQKIASRMVDCLRSNFILGLFVSLEELAFTDPTEDGMQFAASYTGTDNFLVYK